MKKELFIEQFGCYFELVDLKVINEIAVNEKIKLRYLGIHTEISKLRKVMCYVIESIGCPDECLCVLTVDDNIHIPKKINKSNIIKTYLDVVSENLKDVGISNTLYEEGLWYGLAKSLYLLDEISASEFAIMYMELKNSILQKQNERAQMNAQGDL